jgi:hypothetical protein
MIEDRKNGGHPQLRIYRVAQLVNDLVISSCFYSCVFKSDLFTCLLGISRIITRKSNDRDVDLHLVLLISVASRPSMTGILTSIKLRLKALDNKNIRRNFRIDTNRGKCGHGNVWEFIFWPFRPSLVCGSSPHRSSPTCLRHQ